jgi:PAS domain S-box-containing protein
MAPAPAPASRRSARELGRLLVTVWPLLATVVVLIGLGVASMGILSGARAYVAGESLWSKAQKEAVLALLEYGETREPAHYRRFQSSIAVILGDRAARQALEASPPDHQEARRGFLAGGNDPADIDGLILLFERFGHVSFFARPIAVWRRGDEYVLQLADMGAAMHTQISSGHADADGLERLRARVRSLDAELTPLTVQFSTLVGEAARTTRLLLSLLMVVAAALLVPLGLVIIRRLLDAGVQMRADAVRLQERLERHEEVALQKLLLECQAEASSDGILAADADGQIVTRNRALDELWRLPPAVRSVAAVRAHIATQLVAPARFVDELVRLGMSSSGSGARTQLVLKLRDGRTVLWRDAPMIDAHGRSHGRVSSFADITPLVRAEERARSHEAFSRAIVDHAGDAILTSDREGRIVEWNSAAQAIFGFAREQAIGCVVGTLWDGAPVAAGERVERLARTAAGAEVPVEIVRSDVKAVEGDFAVWIVRDLSAATRAAADHAALEQQRLEMARQQGRAQVADNVLHCIGNVLNSVNVSAGLSLEGVARLNLDGVSKAGRLLVGEDALGTRTPQAVAKVGDYLGQLAEQLGRERAGVIEELRALGGHVDQLRTIVSMQEALAQSDLVVDELLAVPLTHEAIGRLAPSFREHGIAVVCADSPEVKGRRLRSERHRVLDVLVQLLSNARDALVARDGAEPKRIEVRLTEHGEDGISWEVIDNGVGILPEHQERLFGLGFTTKADGHGFGLHGSALAAQRLNGSLSGRSEGLNRGATFTLRLRDLQLPS